jgi:coatomer subunit epsilon
MSRGSEPDPLYKIKNDFFAGSFSDVLRESQSISPSSPLVKDERDFYMYRAYIATGNFQIVVNEVKGQSPQQLAIRLFAK